jgi:hypothetical protein
MTCEACTKAAAEPWHGITAGCNGCRLRDMSRGEHFQRVKRTGALDRRYLLWLDGFGLKHDDLKAAAATDFMQRGENGD